MRCSLLAIKSLEPHTPRSLAEEESALRLYTTDQGIAREHEPGLLALLDLAEPDLGTLLRGRGLDAARTARVVREIPREDVILRAPVERPGQVVIVGLNYPSHTVEARALFAEMGQPDIVFPIEPNVLSLAASAVTGPGAPVLLPGEAPSQVDYEGELAIVIGHDARDISAEDAWRYVAGLCIINDVSARDIQIRAMRGDATVTVAGAKSFDTFKPFGPCLVTADEFDSAPDLRIRTLVNGELRQDDRTGNFIHPIPKLLSYMSRIAALRVGDVVSTGTPAGAGLFSKRFLEPGDRVEIDVEGVGVLSNPVVAAG
jgi:2-keto-4-pentenoate hydratase/2-oxohepta-3-ene-1,7-dioic acid hydratase in catechol pathway